MPPFQDPEIYRDILDGLQIGVSVIDLTVKMQYTHQLCAAELLGLASHLYGANPQAFCVSLTGQCFEHGEQLSESVAAGLPCLAANVEQLTRQALT